MRVLHAFTLALVAASIAAPAFSRASTAPTYEQDYAALEQINGAWLKSYETRDPALFTRVLSDDFIGVYGQSVLSKPQMLAGLATRPLMKTSFVDLKISVTGDTAVVAATSTITTTQADGEAVARYRYADVYQRRHGDWKAVASHVVKID